MILFKESLINRNQKVKAKLIWEALRSIIDFESIFRFVILDF